MLGFSPYRLFLKPPPRWPLRRYKPLIELLLSLFLICLISKRRANSLVLPSLLVIKPSVESKNPLVNLRRLSNRAVSTITRGVSELRNKKWQNSNLTYGTSILGRSVDIHHLPYKDDEFDVVLCSETLEQYRWSHTASKRLDSLLLGDNMKKLLCIAILLLIPSWCFALTGYTNHKIITLTGSSAASASAGYVVPIRVSPDADPVESGTWTVNSTVYKYRIPITVKEVTGSALTNYPCLVEINTKALYQRGFISATQTGGEFEFYDGSTNYTYYVFTTDSNSLKAGFRQYRTRYYVQLSLTANQTKTIYFYFSNTVRAVSTNSKTLADIFTVYSYDSRITTNLADVRYDTVLLNYKMIDDSVLSVGYWTGSFGFHGAGESGMHFTGINLNSNASFMSVIAWAGATLSVTSWSGLGFDAGTNLSSQTVAEAADNAAIFSTATDYKSRVKSSTAVAWNITSAWTNGVEYTSPNISTVIQSVIGRSGFVTGNNLNLYWQKTSSCALNQRRTIVPYNTDPTKSARLQFTVYLHPDYRKIPLVTMPQLVKADVYLDAGASAFPYDVAFTAADGTTQLYQADMPERLVSDTKVVTWGIKTSAVVPQSGNLTLNVWYTNVSQTTKHAYWSAADTFTYFNDFESGITGFTTVAGTWVQGSQQMPIIKGGVNGWTRAPVMWKVGSTYKVLDTPAYRWNDFGQLLRIWEIVWSEGTLHTASNMTDYWYTTGYPNYEDRSNPYPTGQNYWEYTDSIVTNDGGTTYYRTYVNSGGDVGLAKSLDGGTTWAKSDAIWHNGDQGVPADAMGNVNGFLFWESPTWYLYLGYSGYTGSPLYVATRTNASPEGAFTIYANGGVPYNLHPYEDYEEAVGVYKDGSTYYTFAGNIQMCPAPVNGSFCQRIVYATANSPLGDTVTHKFSQPVAIDNTLDYTGTFAEQGMPYLLKDGSDWYMTYFGEPRTTNNLVDVNNIDNFLYLAKATSFPTTWAAQKVHKTLNCTSTGNREIIVKDTTAYSNMVINTNIEIPYGNANGGGVVFRYQDSSNYYYVWFNKTWSTLYLFKVVAGVETWIGYAPLKFTMNNNAGGTFYPIRIGLYGSQIVVSMSQYGTFWDTYMNISDASLPTSGQIGFIGVGGLLNIDDLAISPYVYPEVSITRAYTPTQLTPGTTFKIGTGTTIK